MQLFAVSFGFRNIIAVAHDIAYIIFLWLNGFLFLFFFFPLLGFICHTVIATFQSLFIHPGHKLQYARTELTSRHE